MNWKEVYTKIFLKQSEKAISEANIKEYMATWWQNTRSKDVGGLRLTDEGYRYISEDLQITTYEVPYPSDLEFTTQVLLFLDRYIDCPYYIGKRNLIVTNEKKALELHLFSGDIRKYGINKALKRQKSE